MSHLNSDIYNYNEVDIARCTSRPVDQQFLAGNIYGDKNGLVACESSSNQG